MKGIGKIATTKLLLCSTTSKTNTFLKSNGSVIRSSSRSRIKSAYSDTWMRASIFMTLISSKEEPGGFGRRQFSPLCRLLPRKDSTGAGNKTYSESCTKSPYYCRRNWRSIYDKNSSVYWKYSVFLYETSVLSEKNNPPETETLTFPSSGLSGLIRKEK